MGAIYTIQNLANGKVYVGQTVKRSWRDRYISVMSPQVNPRQRLLRRAFVKHGKSSFSFMDLMENVSERDLDVWERFWINCLCATDPEMGYNLETGGRAQKHIALDTRIRMSRSMAGKNLGKSYPKWNASRRERYRHELHGMYRPFIWEHAVHGRFIGGGKQLAQSFPELARKRGNLSKVANGHRNHCHGWRCIGEAPVNN